MLMAARRAPPTLLGSFLRNRKNWRRFFVRREIYSFSVKLASPEYRGAQVSRVVIIVVVAGNYCSREIQLSRAQGKNFKTRVDKGVRPQTNYSYS